MSRRQHGVRIRHEPENIAESGLQRRSVDPRSADPRTAGIIGAALRRVAEDAHAAALAIVQLMIRRGLGGHPDLTRAHLQRRLDGARVEAADRVVEHHAAEHLDIGL
jgi:hypothetical protein